MSSQLESFIKTFISFTQPVVTENSKYYLRFREEKLNSLIDNIRLVSYYIPVVNVDEIQETDTIEKLMDKLYKKFYIEGVSFIHFLAGPGRNLVNAIFKRIKDEYDKTENNKMNCF